MKWIVYKTVNLINGRYYIGVHKQEQDDDYLGSGKLIKEAIKKYGKRCFKRITLFEFDNSSDAFNKEADLVPNIKKDLLCYNLADGGIGRTNLGTLVSTNKLGFHSFNKKQRLENSRKGTLALKLLGKGFFDKKVCAAGGKIGGLSNIGSFWYNDGSKNFKYMPAQSEHLSFIEYLDLHKDFIPGRLNYKKIIKGYKI